MNYYLCTLESGRDFILKADDPIEAAYEATEEAKVYDDYLTDLKPINETTYTPYYAW